MRGHTAADRLAAALAARGVSRIFGLPGSQIVPLYEAFRRTGLQCVSATHELAASFMANGYARASGRPGVLATIPGPGFTWALTGLAEARLDSAPVLHLTGTPATGPGRRFQLQAFDQRSVAAPLVKAVITVTRAEEVGPRTLEALDLTTRGEPGPVLLQVAGDVWGEAAPDHPLDDPRGGAPPAEWQVAAITSRLVAANRPLFFLGQGAASASDAATSLARQLDAIVVTTTSGRGVLPEDDPRVLVFDGGDVEALNQLAASADLVLALGCKFSHNGAYGFDVRLRADALVHVDASPEVLGANYPCSLAVTADVPAMLAALTSRPELRALSPSGWSPQDKERWRAEALDPRRHSDLEFLFPGLEPPTAEAFFAALRRVLPRDGCLVTDSGQHQMLARRHHRVHSPRGLIVPSNLQSMGFALPAAIGAAFVEPRRPVVALLGDGGLLMSGLELATAAREGLALTAIVMVDGHYGQIRLKQLHDTGHPFATDLPRIDLQALAEATGATYRRLSGDPGPALRESLGSGGVTLMEVPAGDSPGLRRLRGRAVLKRGADALGVLGALRRLRGR